MVFGSVAGGRRLEDERLLAGHDISEAYEEAIGVGEAEEGDAAESDEVSQGCEGDAGDDGGVAKRHEVRR